jgi:Protein of unknown function (DUF805)
MPVGILVLGSLRHPRRYRGRHYRLPVGHANRFEPFRITLLPGIAVSIRRLHDLDRTGWWILLALIPLIGWIILLIWYISKGTDGPNRFGPDPLATLAIPAAPRAA